jgi:MYND finger/Plasmid pRiA4b ORF-3-like protein
MWLTKQDERQYVHDDGVQTFHLLPRVGSECLWQYDYGDKWELRLRVEELTEKKTVSLRGGKGCPLPEDGQGNRKTALVAAKILVPGLATPAKRREAVSEWERAANFQMGLELPADLSFSQGKCAAVLKSAQLGEEVPVDWPKADLMSKFGGISFGSDMKYSGVTGGLANGPVLGGIPVINSAHSSSMSHVAASQTAKSVACWACGAEDKKTNLCGRCKKARYCGAACQRAHWGKHKAECQ